MKRLYKFAAATALALAIGNYANAQYCTSNAILTGDEVISNVTLVGNSTTINNTSGTTCATYTDFTALSADVWPGFGYTLNAFLNTCGGNFTKSARAWIDWNQNNVFDASEQVMCTPGSSLNRNESSFFTVPAGAAIGQTRMRVVCSEVSNCLSINACGTYLWGETEDYTINVTPAPPAKPGGYCASGATFSDDSEIQLVSLTGESGTSINNASGGCAQYTDYTGLAPAWISPSASYTVSTTLGSCGGNFTKMAKVYIDFNRDGDFTDFAEEIGCVGPTTTTANFNLPFIVPSNASFGFTCMRVVLVETGSCSNISPCGSYSWGETEDYSLLILPQDSCLAPVELVDLAALHCLDGAVDTFNGSPVAGVFSGTGVTTSSGTSSATYTGPLAIPDNTFGGATANVTVAGIPNTVLGQNVWLDSVEVNITHTWVGDLVVILTSPSGDTVQLSERPGLATYFGCCGCSQDNIAATWISGFGTNFVPEAEGLCPGSPPALSGQLRPVGSQSLDDLNDGVTDPNGTWSLLVRDLAGGDVGTIDDYTLYFTYQEAYFDPISAGQGIHSIEYSHDDFFGCSDTARLDVEVYAPDVQIKIIQGADSVCFGDTVTLQATIGGGTAGVLLTTTTGTNGQQGVMFDIDAINDVFIDSFDGLAWAAATTNFEIYFKTGSHVGFETNAGAWTLLGSATGVSMPGPPTLFNIPIATAQLIPAGTRGAFYITTTLGGTFLRYSNGVSVGNIWASDANIIVYEGVGKSYPFNATFTPRNFNGQVYYSPPPDTTNQYLWSTGDTTVTTTFVPPATGDYSVIVIDSNGCNGYDTVTIWVNDEIIIDAPNVDICLGDDVTLGGTPTASGGSGLFQYQWSPPTNLSCVNCPNPVADPSFTTTYLLEIVDSFNCYVSQNVTVTVNPNPEADAGPPQAICPGVTIGIGGSPTGTLGTPPYTYAWTNGGTLDNANAANPNATPASTTQYNVVVTDANGCTAEDSVIVVVLLEPDASILTTGPYCDNAGIQILMAATPGGTWSGTGIVNPATGAFDPAVAGAGVHNITYVVTNAVGCTTMDTEPITVYQSPTPSITSGTDYCDNQSNVFLTATPGPGTWSGAGIVNAATGEFSPMTAGTGSHVIMYSYTDGNGCTGTTMATITVHKSPDATINAAGPFCENAGPQQLTAATPGGTWSGPGTSPSGIFDPAAAGPGIHTVNYTVTDVNGCTDNDTEDIEVLSAPQAAITAAGPFCANDAATTLTATPGSGTNYWSGAGITNALTGMFDPSSAGAGSHLITLVKTYANGCASTATTTITVNALPDATISDPGILCANGAAVQLTAATGGGTWSGTGVSPSGLFNPQTAGPGTHTITYTVTDGNGCTNSDDIDITVTPDIVITGDVVDVLCNGGASGEIDVTVIGGTPPYTYSWTGPSGFTASTQDINKLEAGTYDLTVTDNNGCTETASFTVNEPTVISITSVVVDALSPNYDNGSIDITVSGGTPPYQFIWSNGETTEDVEALQPDTYMVTIVDANGCRYTFDITVNAQFGLGITQAELNNGLFVFPNPSDGLINVELDLGVTAEVNLVMLDMIGRSVYTYTDHMVNTYQHRINMSDWASGQYILFVQVGERQVQRKVVLTK